MAVTDNLRKFSAVPSAAISMGKILKEGAASGGLPGCATSTATSDKIMGVSDADYASGEVASVVSGGIVDYVIAGETLTPGTTYHVTTDNQGRAVAASAGVAEVKCLGYFIRGCRSDGTAHVGEQCSIQVDLHSLAPTA